MKAWAGLCALTAGGFFFLWPAYSHAGETAKYVITIQSVELKTTGGEWKTLIRPDKQVDLVQAEPTIALFNNGQIPPGGYVNFRITLSETIIFAGRDKSYGTRQGGSLTLKGSASKASELPGRILDISETAPTIAEDAMGDVTQHLDFDGGDEDHVMTMFGKRELTTPLLVKKGSFVKIWFDIHLDEAVQYAWPRMFGSQPDHDMMYVLPPKEVAEFIIEVDERKETLSPEAVVLEF